jgi:hypothetical protein
MRQDYTSAMRNSLKLQGIRGSAPLFRRWTSTNTYPRSVAYLNRMVSEGLSCLSDSAMAVYCTTKNQT